VLGSGWLKRIREVYKAYINFHFLIFLTSALKEAVCSSKTLAYSQNITR
jgi:hypothetical protein